MEVPDLLREYAKTLLTALNVPTPGEWPGEPFVPADQPEAIARILIPVLHSHLEEPLEARIVYLFREKLSKKAAVASKAGAKLVYLGEVDFTIEFDWTQWRTLTAEQRIALVDHELCHCAWDGEHEKWAMREHDVEEFGEIVQRWGLWQPRLKDFGVYVKPHVQTELFRQAS